MYACTVRMAFDNSFLLIVINDQNVFLQCTVFVFKFVSIYNYDTRQTPNIFTLFVTPIRLEKDCAKFSRTSTNCSNIVFYAGSPTLFLAHV